MAVDAGQKNYSNYIYYFYENYEKWGVTKSELTKFYGSKGRKLQEQLNMATAQEVRLKQLAAEINVPGFTELMDTVLKPGEPLENILISKHQKSQTLITSGANAGVNKSTSMGKLEGFFSKENISKKTGDWVKWAEGLQKGMETYLSDLYMAISSKEMNDYLMATYLNNDALSNQDRKSLYNLIMKEIQKKKESVYDLVPANAREVVAKTLPKLEKSLKELQSLQNRYAGQGATISFEDKNIMESLAKTFSTSVKELSSVSGEIADMHMLNSANLMGFKSILTPEVSITGGERKTEYHMDKELEKIKKEFGISTNSFSSSSGESNLLAPQIKKDLSVIFKDNGDVEFELGISSKRASPATMKVFGISLVSTKLLIVMAKITEFVENKRLRNAMMNVAMGQPMGEQDTYAADLEWNNIKRMIAISNLYWALSGIASTSPFGPKGQYMSGKDANVAILMLNGKPFLISDIIRAVKRSEADGLESIFGGTGSLFSANKRPAKYLTTNLYVGGDPADKSSRSHEKAWVRSDEASRLIYQDWAQQAFNIKLNPAKLIGYMKFDM